MNKLRKISDWKIEIIKGKAKITGVVTYPVSQKYICIQPVDEYLLRIDFENKLVSTETNYYELG